MKRILLLAFGFSFLLSRPSIDAMGEKPAVPSRQDKVTYAEVVKDHPQLKEMVDENGFNNLSGEEQWNLINLVDKYAFFLHEGEYYTGESPAQAMVYLQKANSLKKKIQKRFGDVLKK